MNAPLECGTLEGWIVTCPLHCARFDVRSGECVAWPLDRDPGPDPLPPTQARYEKMNHRLQWKIRVHDLPTYPVRVGSRRHDRGARLAPERAGGAGHRRLAVARRCPTAATSPALPDAVFRTRGAGRKRPARRFHRRGPVEDMEAPSGGPSMSASSMRRQGGPTWRSNFRPCPTPRMPSSPSTRPRRSASTTASIIRPTSTTSTS